MDNANKPANPTKISIDRDNDKIKPYQFSNDGFVSLGLTKRERFAMAAMQGMLPEFKSDQSEIPHQSLIAEYAVHYADALLTELNE